MRSAIVTTRTKHFLRRLSAFLLLFIIPLSLLSSCSKKEEPPADSSDDEAVTDLRETSEVDFADGANNSALSEEGDSTVGEDKTVSEIDENLNSEPEEDSNLQVEIESGDAVSPKPADPDVVPPTLNENGEITEVTDNWLLLVNKTHPLSESYEPTDLIVVQHQVGSHAAIMRYMRQEAAEHLDAMCAAAAEEGHEIGIRTAYRPYSYQKGIFNDYANRYGEEEANRFSARPGQSEHQTGLCADVTSPSVDYKLTTEYGKAPEGIWLAENAHRFGFIIRYPLGKEDITGYQYEPWHVRYVGEEAAAKIYEQGITLEEYLGILD